MKVLSSRYALSAFFLYMSSTLLQASMPASCIDALNKKIAQMQPITEDITYLIADLKFDGKQVKICEFGEGTCSRFKGYDYMVGKGVIWDQFWNILHQYDFPKWYVDADIMDKYLYRSVDAEIHLSNLLNYQGYAIGSINALECNPLFTRTFNQKTNQDVKSNVHTKGLVMVRHHNSSISSIAALRNKYRDLMVLNSAAAPFVNDKYTTDILFKEPDLQPFRPQAMLCKRSYTPGLAGDIKTKLPSAFYVIKPLNAFKGCGVIMVAAGHLDMVLKNIMMRNSRIHRAEKTYRFNGYSYTDKTFSYWDEYKEPYFIIEEMCLSKILEFEGKRYDPTMRVVFVLRYFNDEVTIDYLASYWKLPLKSLDEHGTLTEKHKSVGIIPVATTEEEKVVVYGQLDELLPKLYRKMISIINNKTPLEVPLMA